MLIFFSAAFRIKLFEHLHYNFFISRAEGTRERVAVGAAGEVVAEVLVIVLLFFVFFLLYCCGWQVRAFFSCAANAQNCSEPLTGQ